MLPDLGSGRVSNPRSCRFRQNGGSAAFLRNYADLLSTAKRDMPNKISVHFAGRQNLQHSSPVISRKRKRS